MSKYKIIMTGGGTAGHVTPNLALIPELKKRGFDIKYIGSKDGIEKEIIGDANIPYFSISFIYSINFFTVQISFWYFSGYVFIYFSGTTKTTFSLFISSNCAEEIPC